MQKEGKTPRIFVCRSGLIADQEDIRESHFHRLYEIFLVRRGSMRILVGNRECEVSSGCLVIIPKGVKHKTIYGTEECERDLIQFSIDYISPVIGTRMYRFFPNNVFTPMKDEIEKRVYDIFAKIEAESACNDSYSDEMFKAYVNELLTLVLRNPQYQNRAEMSGKRVSSQSINDTVHYIATHFNEQLTLEELARRASVSTSHYSRSFREATGYGFKEYLNMVRIAEARRLLLGTDQSVCDVAYASGFNDSNYFSTCFKQIHGESPLSFRHSHRISEKHAEYDHQSYVQDPAGSRHSVLRITSDRGERMTGSRTIQMIAASAQDVPDKTVSFRVYVPSRNENRLHGDFFTDASFPVMYQLYVVTGEENQDNQHYLTLLNLRALTDQSTQSSEQDKIVRGFDFLFSTGEHGEFSVRRETGFCLTLDAWHEVALHYDFSERKNPRCTMVIDGREVETTDQFYYYADGIRYQPRGAVSFLICTLMRTCGTVYFDDIGYSEAISAPEIKEKT